jgi:hypothetical protein
MKYLNPLIHLPLIEVKEYSLENIILNMALLFANPIIDQKQILHTSLLTIDDHSEREIVCQLPHLFSRI